MAITEFKIGTIIFSARANEESLLEFLKPEGVTIDDNFNIISIKQNKRYMKQTDPRITQLKRDYLYSHFITKDQEKRLLEYCERNNVELLFDKPPTQYADEE